MKKLSLLILCLGFLSAGTVHSATGSNIHLNAAYSDDPGNKPAAISAAGFLKMTNREFERLTGRRLNLKDRFALLILRHRIKKDLLVFPEDAADKNEKKAKAAKFLGMASLLLLFIPFLDILSLPMAILAIIFGSKTINKIKDKRVARTGIIFGCITLGLLVLVAATVALVISAAGPK